MLRRLLHLVVTEGTVEPHALARALGVHPQQVEQMFDDLKRHGYLTEVAADCGQPCNHCPQSAACIYPHRARLWVLTDKGTRLALSENP